MQFDVIVSGKKNKQNILECSYKNF